MKNEDKCEQLELKLISEAAKTLRLINGKQYYDRVLEGLPLTKRAKQKLNELEIHCVSEFLLFPYENWLGSLGIGTNTLANILQVREDLEQTKFLTQVISIGNDRENKLEDICIDVVQEIRCRHNFHAGKLYEQLYPIFEEMLNHVNLSHLDIYEHETYFVILSKYNDLRNILKSNIVKFLEPFPNGQTLYEIINIMPKGFNCENIVKDLLQELCFKDETLRFEEDKFIILHISIMEYADTLAKENFRYVLKERLRGSTYEKIGKDTNLTRERIRQIAQRCLQDRCAVLEDQYRDMYMQYNITKDDFLLGFDEQVYVYNYLSAVYERGTKTLDMLLSDENFSIRIRKCAEKIVYQDYIQFGGEYVECNKSALCEYVVRTYGTDEITVGEFECLYFKIIEEKGLSGDTSLTELGRGYQNKLVDCDYVLWKYGKKLRYYNMKSFDFTELLSQLNLAQYTNVEYSALKFYRMHKDLMEFYDIRDEYELHNLLKKLLRKEVNYKITFNRMPNIEFGVANREQQVLNMLFLLAPITNDDLAKAYENEYGVLSKTVLANYFKHINLYFYNGSYSIDMPVPSEDVLADMKTILKEDFYFISQMKEIIMKNIRRFDLKNLNTYTMKKLGFRVFSNYVVRDSYASATDYFRYLLLGKDIVDVRTFPKDVGSIIAYTSELHDLKMSYEIVEYDTHHYISILKLNTMGITKDLLYDYCEKVSMYVDDSQYFTVLSLMKQGFVHELGTFKFDHLFYASLLVGAKERFSFRRVGKTKLFVKGNRDVRISSFIEEIVKSAAYSSMKLSDLNRILQNEYGIHSDQWKLLEFIKGSAMYYEPIRRRIYSNYTEYEEASKQLNFVL